jgi:EAL domain-containing protein (putative c-di-GMP-specific phosphodiesterase class I)
MCVIAEGVEHDTQASVLRAIGCHEMQGYLFGKPARLEDFKRLYARSGKEHGQASGLRVVR